MRELVLIQSGRMLEGLTAREAGEAHANREFEKRLAECGPLAFRVAQGVLRNAADAEDVAQEALLRAYRNFARLRAQRRGQRAGGRHGSRRQRPRLWRLPLGCCDIIQNKTPCGQIRVALPRTIPLLLCSRLTLRMRNSTPCRSKPFGKRRLRQVLSCPISELR